MVPAVASAIKILRYLARQGGRSISLEQVSPRSWHQQEHLSRYSENRPSSSWAFLILAHFQTVPTGSNWRRAGADVCACVASSVFWREDLSSKVKAQGVGWDDPR